MGKRSKIAAIDLFCGTGGLSLGLKQGGIRVVAGIDNASACSYPYSHNIKAKFIERSVCDVTGEDLQRLWGQADVRLLAGCAPCQPFSSQRRGADTSHEKSWPLLNEFARLVQETMPDFVTMENVPRVQYSPIFDEFVARLKQAGYDVTYRVLFGPDYGLPQRRRRLVLLAALNDHIEMPEPTVGADRYRTVYDAIHDLPSLEAGQKDDDDSLHFARNLSPTNLKRAHASKPGGTWEDWPEELRAPCQTRDSGKSFKSFYGRMEWNKPSPTITTQSYNPGAGRFTHPAQDRALTLREASRLQGFPDSFVFTGPSEKITLSTVGRLIGNAVPPVFGKAIARQFIKTLDDRK